MQTFIAIINNNSSKYSPEKSMHAKKISNCTILKVFILIKKVYKHKYTSHNHINTHLYVKKKKQTKSKKKYSSLRLRCGMSKFNLLKTIKHQACSPS